MVARCVLPESLSHGTFFSPRVCLLRSSLRQPRSLTLRAGATRTEGPSSHQNTRRRTTPPRSFSQCGIRRSMLQRGDEPRNPWASVIEGPSRHRAQHNQHSGRPERGHTRVERNAAGRHTQSHSEATTSSFVVGATWCALAWSRLPKPLAGHTAVMVGSGPVGLRCVLELRLLGAEAWTGFSPTNSVSICVNVWCAVSNKFVSSVAGRLCSWL